VNIGIKYCGGCNPKFDRKAFVEELKSRHKDINFEIASETSNYELVFLVNGCSRACVSKNKYSFKRIISLDSPDKLDVLDELINKLLNP
jgi:4-hydroxybutyrate CoA-transferase